MNAASFNSRSKQSIRDFANPGCRDVVTMGDRELSAFFRAVTELFGSEQAQMSAEDWLNELSESDGVPSSICEWRAITAIASSRLAGRVNGSPLVTEVHNV